MLAHPTRRLAELGLLLALAGLPAGAAGVARAAGATPTPPPLAAELPPETLLAVFGPSRPELLAAAKNSGLGRILAEPDVRAFLRPLAEKLRLELGRGLRAQGFAWSDFAPLVDREWAVGLLALPAGAPPHFFFVADCRDDAAALEAHLADLAGRLAPELLRRRQVRGQNAYRFGAQNEKGLYWAFVAGRLLLTDDAETLDRLVAPHLSSTFPTPALAREAAFGAAAARRGRAQLFAWLDCVELFRLLPNPPPRPPPPPTPPPLTPREALERLGLDSVRSLTLAIEFTPEGELRERLELAAPEDGALGGLLALLAASGPAPTAAPAAPRLPVTDETLLYLELHRDVALDLALLRERVAPKLAGPEQAAEAGELVRLLLQSFKVWLGGTEIDQAATGELALALAEPPGGGARLEGALRLGLRQAAPFREWLRALAGLPDFRRFFRLEPVAYRGVEFQRIRPQVARPRPTPPPSTRPPPDPADKKKDEPKKNGGKGKEEVPYTLTAAFADEALFLASSSAQMRRTLDFVLPAATPPAAPAASPVPAVVNGFAAEVARREAALAPGASGVLHLNLRLAWTQLYNTLAPFLARRPLPKGVRFDWEELPRGEQVARHLGAVTLVLRPTGDARRLELEAHSSVGLLPTLLGLGASADFVRKVEEQTRERLEHSIAGPDFEEREVPPWRPEPIEEGGPRPPPSRAPERPGRPPPPPLPTGEAGETIF